MKAKTRKIFECSYDGVYVVITFTAGECNPYRVYSKYYDKGWHRKLLDKYADFNSCMCLVWDYYRQNTNVYKD